MRWVGASLLAVVGCNGTPDAEQRFADEVVPVLERSCAAGTCHGVGPGAEADGEIVDWDLFHFRVDRDGHLTDLAAARNAARRTINTIEDPAFSSLLRKPLHESFGGLPHYGRANFVDPDDSGYQALARWIDSEASGGEDPAPLSADVQWFADHVRPVLTSLTCANGNCHGPSAAIPFHLDPGWRGVLSAEGIRRDYTATLAKLALDGDPLQSRLIRKALPLHAGGMVHKGGNSSFLLGSDDPRLATLVAWVCREQASRSDRDCSPQPPSGIVFVRGPLGPTDPFQADDFQPGTDLFFAPLDADLRPDAARNLTDSLHSEPADIRDPAVSPDGAHVAFAMRTEAAGGHDLWELALQTGEARRLTDDAGPMAGGALRTYRDPSYGPDGALYFVSTAAGVLADDGQRLDTDVYALDLASGHLSRRTATPHIERKVVYFTNGAEIAFTALRDVVPTQARAHIFRFPPGLQTEYHQHFGVTPDETLTYDMRELPDGRFVTVLGDLSNRWGGRLAVVDRNFGPEINASAADLTPSLPAYAAPLVRLDPTASASGLTERAYRDPAALPSGQILAAVAEGPLDLGDPQATPDFAIHLITLEEAADGSGPRIASSAVLLDAPGLSDFDPEPVFVRYLPADEGPWAWDPAASTGVIRHQGMDAIDGLLANLAPSGTKDPSAHFAAVRVIEALPLTPAQRWPVPPEETREGLTTASNLSLSPHGPSRILAELPLAADGTFHAELPSGIAVRLQGLDARGMAVGVMHNRWFDINPGQTLPQGVQPPHYKTLCAGCHGAADGDPDHVFVEPDLLTTASLTLSRYENQNPRRPIPAPLLGEETASTVDFLRDIQPILDRACASCHSGDEPAAGLSLTATPTEHYVDSYESLLAPGDDSRHGFAFVDAAEGSAHGSWLTEKLLGEELGAPRDLDTPGQPHPDADTLDDADWQQLIRWMDLGATWVGAMEDQ